MQSKGYADESAKGVAGTGRCVCICVCGMTKGHTVQQLIFHVLLHVPRQWPSNSSLEVYERGLVCDHFFETLAQSKTVRKQDDKKHLLPQHPIRETWTREELGG